MHSTHRLIVQKDHGVHRGFSLEIGPLRKWYYMFGWGATIRWPWQDTFIYCGKKEPMVESNDYMDSFLAESLEMMTKMQQNQKTRLEEWAMLFSVSFLEMPFGNFWTRELLMRMIIFAIFLIIIQMLNDNHECQRMNGKYLTLKSIAIWKWIWICCWFT